MKDKTKNIIKQKREYIKKIIQKLLELSFD